MKDVSVFDIIGPVMIGPSSSHTAGALQIALFAHNLASGRIKEVKFLLYGSFAKTYRGHGTDRALLAGILGLHRDDYRIANSFALADEAGLKYSFETDGQNTDVHPNTVDITIKDEAGNERFVRGESIGGGNITIRNIDGIDIDLSGKYNTLLIMQEDEPGVISGVTGVLSRHGINIAFMRVYREAKGKRAYSIIETDEDMPRGVTESLLTITGVTKARFIGRMQ